MTTELIGKVGRDAKLEAHVKSCHSDDGDNDDDNEYSDDDTDEVENDDDDDDDAKVDWKKGRDAGWRCVSNPLMAPITASTVCLRELLSWHGEDDLDDDHNHADHDDTNFNIVEILNKPCITVKIFIESFSYIDILLWHGNDDHCDDDD